MFIPLYKNVEPDRLDAVKRYWDRWGMARGSKDYVRLSMAYLQETGRMSAEETKKLNGGNDMTTIEGQHMQDRARDARMEDGDQSMWSTSWNERN